jgi:hypothetical protein
VLLEEKYKIESTILCNFIGRKIKSGRKVDLEEPIPNKSEFSLLIARA